MKRQPLDHVRKFVPRLNIETCPRCGFGGKEELDARPCLDFEFNYNAEPGDRYSGRGGSKDTGDDRAFVNA